MNKKKETLKYIYPENISGKTIADVRKQLGMTQKEFASFANVSKPTVERWESGDKPVGGSIVTLVEIIRRRPEFEQSLRIPGKTYPLRLWYYCADMLCTIIDVDEIKQRVEIHNYVDDLLKRAFGRNEHPTITDYEEFLESRCFPRERDKIKIYLNELDIPFYDPLLIIEKTKGRLTDDDFWIEIER